MKKIPPTERRFSENARKKGDFVAAFNHLVARKFDAEAFYALAQESGWREARVSYPGSTTLYQRDHEKTRITAEVNELGFIKRYSFG